MTGHLVFVPPFLILYNNLITMNLFSWGCQMVFLEFKLEICGLDLSKVTKV